MTERSGRLIEARMVSGSGARDLDAATLAVAEAGLPPAIAASDPLRARIEFRFARAP